MFCQLVSINAAWGLLRLRRTRLQDVWLSRLETRSCALANKSPSAKRGRQSEHAALCNPLTALFCNVSAWRDSCCLQNAYSPKGRKFWNLKTFLIFPRAHNVVICNMRSLSRSANTVFTVSWLLKSRGLFKTTDIVILLESYLFRSSISFNWQYFYPSENRNQRPQDRRDQRTSGPEDHRKGKCIKPCLTKVCGASRPPQLRRDPRAWTHSECCSGFSILL